ALSKVSIAQMCDAGTQPDKCRGDARVIKHSGNFSRQATLWMIHIRLGKVLHQFQDLDGRKRSAKLRKTKLWASLRFFSRAAVRGSKPPRSTSTGADIWCRKIAANSSVRQSLSRSRPAAIRAASLLTGLLDTALAESNSDITTPSPVTGRVSGSCILQLSSTPSGQT